LSLAHGRIFLILGKNTNTITTIIMINQFLIYVLTQQSNVQLQN
jgi:hypothetical protein